MNETKLVKFETIIEDINYKITKDAGDFFKKDMNCIGVSNYNVALGLLFDYDSCNEYAKIIIEKSEIFLTNAGIDPWKSDYPKLEVLNDLKTKIKATKSFVEYCKETENMFEGYKLIFWSLMILAVDKSHVEEKLSGICDFAVMLGITEAGFEDIIHVVKEVFYEGSGKYEYKTEIVKNIFGALFGNGNNSSYDDYDLKMEQLYPGLYAEKRARKENEVKKAESKSIFSEETKKKSCVLRGINGFFCGE